MHFHKYLTKEELAVDLFSPSSSPSASLNILVGT
jgi:hypothetical protein